MSGAHRRIDVRKRLFEELIFAFSPLFPILEGIFYETYVRNQLLNWDPWSHQKTGADSRTWSESICNEIWYDWFYRQYPHEIHSKNWGMNSFTISSCRRDYPISNKWCRARWSSHAPSQFRENLLRNNWRRNWENPTPFFTRKLFDQCRWKHKDWTCSRHPDEGRIQDRKHRNSGFFASSEWRIYECI